MNCVLSSSSFADLHPPYNAGLPPHRSKTSFKRSRSSFFLLPPLSKEEQDNPSLLLHEPEKKKSKKKKEKKRTLIRRPLSDDSSSLDLFLPSLSLLVSLLKGVETTSSFCLSFFSLSFLLSAMKRRKQSICPSTDRERRRRRFLS